jgi:predicted ATP-grasp superfamily ATP-dependent carboligase
VPCSSPNAYGVVRGLSAAGIRVVALDHTPETPLRHSRLFKFGLCPDPCDSEEGFVRALLDLAGGMKDKPVVFPTQDLHTFVLCRHYEELVHSVVFSFLDVATALDCIDKRRMYPLAEAAGLRVPETHFPQNPNQLLEMLPSLGKFPYIVKPAAKFDICDGSPCRNLHFYKKYGTKALRAKTRAELVDKFGGAWRSGFSTVVQEEIEGPALNLWAIDFYATKDSDIAGYHTGHKIRQFPSDFGTCTLGCSAIRAELFQLCSSLVKVIRFHGIGNIEFKENNGRLYFLELNPRPWQWLHLATASGVNLPLLAYSDLLHLSVHPPVCQKKSVVWIDLRRDTKHLKRSDGDSVPTERLGLGKWLMSLRRARIEAMSSLFDPFPLVVMFWRKLMGSILRKRVQNTKRKTRSISYPTEGARDVSHVPCRDNEVGSSSCHERPA